MKIVFILIQYVLIRRELILTVLKVSTVSEETAQLYKLFHMGINES